MGWGFRKSVNIMPGVKINLSRSGPSISLGPKGLKYNINSRGSRVRCSIPGTGVYYTKNLSDSVNTNRNNIKNAAVYQNCNKTNMQNDNRLKTLGFFEKLSLTNDERQFLYGLKEFINGNLNNAKEKLFRCNNIDSYFLRGFIELGNEEFESAKNNFKMCLVHKEELGKTISKFANEIELILDVTEYIEIPIMPNKKGLYLCLIECYQKINDLREGMKLLYEIQSENSSDKVILLSLIDFIALEDRIEKDDLMNVINLTNELENENAIETNISYLRGYLFYRLDKISLAIAELTKLTRKTKDRPEKLILDIRFLRGQFYEEDGQLAKAKKDYEFIYMKDNNYDGIKEKIF
ncbi:hypothetical protein AXY43_05505 [Clostridium sp. MF28]|uniref:DUF4236 domain-containing protein n=1 Tax=Clostridium TaxID=1485 RepID=UPI000CF8995E|nr:MULTISPECIES: DUF4236 domain-containing protein [Clostridium]AVK47522.1 hypothetical protein AXY43_05505 [Clostridium sp. MF28]PSM58693.1 hypothetical protein C4L39_05885 [Clostridium diolis]